MKPVCSSLNSLEISDDIPNLEVISRVSCLEFHKKTNKMRHNDKLYGPTP